MDMVIAAARVVLIGVLLISGVSKLFDREGSGEAMREFGLPGHFIPIAATTLPWVELLLAFGLIFGATIAPAAGVAVALFLAFTVIVTRSVLRGEAIECHCFGDLDSAPISWWTVARNIALTLVAVSVFWWVMVNGATNIQDGMTWSILGVWLLIGAIGVLGFGMLQLRRIQDALLQRIDDLESMLPARYRIPEGIAFAEVVGAQVVRTAAGVVTPVHELQVKKSPALLIFVSESCRACAALVPAIPEWRERFVGLMPIHLIANSEPGERHGYPIDDVWFTSGAELAETMQVNGMPTAVLIDHDGRIRSKPALGGAAIRRMVASLQEQAGG